MDLGQLSYIMNSRSSTATKLDPVSKKKKEHLRSDLTQLRCAWAMRVPPFHPHGGTGAVVGILSPFVS